MSNTITAFFKGRVGVAESVYQYDYGKILIIDGLSLPASFEVHFTTISEDDAITVIGQNNRVAIPDSCISIPGTVTAYIYLHTGDNDGETEYVIKFAVNRRARPDYDEDDKSDWESAASQALAMLQNSKKVNTPLDEYNQVDNGIAGQLLRTKGDGSTEWVNEGLPTDEQTAAAVYAWLDEHPEATTTVEDGSLSEAKFTNALKLKALKDYVTPEMYGAKGDGETDDTDAWQLAVDTGLPVVATSSNYKCRKISVTKDTTIECNGAKFYCLEDTLFDCKGSVATTLTGESNYSALQVNYAISNASYSNFTGLAMLKGTNNFEKSRSYYKGGFVCEVVNGRIWQGYPVDVTSPSVEILNPITVKISNIADIQHSSYSGATCSIKILYGHNCRLSDINSKASSGYYFIDIDSCFNTIVSGCSIKHSYGTSGTNSYAIVINHSSFTTIEKCYVFNKYWHAISTGGNYLVYKTTVDNCILESDGSAYDDHNNARGTTITNCIVSGSIDITCMSRIENVVISPSYSITDPVCTILVQMSSDKKFAEYSISNVKFLSNLSQTPVRKGINIGIQAEVESVSNVYHLRHLDIKNVIDLDQTYFGSIRFGAISTSNSFWFGEIDIDNTNLQLMAYVPNSVTTADISEYDLTLRNSKERAISVGASSTNKWGNFTINNSKVGTIHGVFANLLINDATITALVNSSNVSVTNGIYGSNIVGCILPALMGATPIVSISNMYNNVLSDLVYNETWLNIGKDHADDHVRWQYWNNGALEIKHSS